MYITNCLTLLLHYLKDLKGNKVDIDTIVNLCLIIKANELDDVTSAKVTTVRPIGYNVTLRIAAWHELTILVRTDDTIDSFDFDFEHYYAARADYFSRDQTQFDLTITREKNSNKQCWTYTYH